MAGLAPEHKWPSARSEALQCYRNLLQKLRIPACKIIIGTSILYYRGFAEDFYLRSAFSHY
jgi:hypothetical protein